MSIFKNTLEKLKHQQQILAILVFAFIAVFIWTGTSLLSSQKTTGISQELQKMAQPLTPNLDQDILQRLQQKISFSKSQLRDFPIYMIYKDKKQGEQMIEIHEVPNPSPSASPSSTIKKTSSVSIGTDSAQTKP